MGILLAGSGPVAFTGTFSTTSTYIDTAYASCSAIGASSGAELPTAIPDGDEYWVHFVMYQTFTGSPVVVGVVFKNAAGADAFNFYNLATNALTLAIKATNTGNTASSAASLGTLAGGATRRVVDVQVKTDSGNAVANIYIGGSLMATASVAGTSRGLKNITFGQFNQSSTAYYSELIVSTTDTRGLRPKTLPFVATGTYTEWTGGVSDIDDAGTPDGLVVKAGAVDQRISFTITDLVGEVDTGTVLIGVCASAGPGYDLVGGLRIDGTDYYGSSLGLTSGMLPFSAIFTENPDTTAPFTAADINSAEFILKAVAA